MIEMHGCTPGMSWGLVFMGMSIGVAFGWAVHGALMRALRDSRPLCHDEFDVPVDKAPGRKT
jgi:hypothetical protein